jgi:NAD(P)-dependent dehydrogenase (short-subunit alcohol dehydrogenase family)
MFSAGLGLQTVKQLALHGANVYIGARSESRAKQAIDSILSENKSIPKDRIRWLALDLSKLSSVLQAVQSFQSEEKRLDILSQDYILQFYC